MATPQFKIQLDTGATLPTRAHASDIGYDLTALDVSVAYRRFGKENLIWKVKIDTGVHITPPKGYYVEVVPNSRLAKTPFVFSNSLGIIDPDYTGSIKIWLNADFNTTNEELIPQVGDVVAQLIIRKKHDADWQIVDQLTPTERGSGGFGSTANIAKSAQ